MAFKRLDAREHRTRSVAGYPQISIGKTRIYLNAQASDMFDEHVEKVVILFDEEEHRLGIKAAKEDDTTAFHFAKNSQYKGRNINSIGVIKRIMGKGYKGTQRYKAEWDEAENMLIVDLGNS